MMAYNRNNNDRTNETIEVEIVKHIGDLAVLQSGWIKEVNIVSWNGGTPKIDIREWSPEHDRMSRGITLYEDEAKKLAEHIGRFLALDKASKVKVTIKDEDTKYEAPQEDMSIAVEPEDSVAKVAASKGDEAA